MTDVSPRCAGATRPLEGRILVAVAVPTLVVAATHLAFRLGVSYLGFVAGYSAGFAFYWVVCLVISIGLLGWSETRQLFAPPHPPFPRQKWLALAILIVPVTGGFVTAFLPYLPTAGGLVIIVAAARAVVNATAEELFWRGLYVRWFAGRPLFGWVLPALGFTAWHLVPLSVTGTTSASFGLLLGAALMGFGNGWIAWRTNSLRYIVIAHVLTDEWAFTRPRWLSAGDLRPCARTRLCAQALRLLARLAGQLVSVNFASWRRP